MMGALIVGGDHVAPYRSFLEQRGFAAVWHWNGRRHSECHRRIPGDTELILVLVDQVNHGLARKVRRLAGEMGVPVLFSRRSRGQLDDALAIHGLPARMPWPPMDWGSPRIHPQAAPGALATCS